MVCKFQRVHYGHIKKKLVIYLDGRLKSGVTDFRIAKIGWFSSSGYEICFGSKAKSLKLEDSYFVNRPYVYVITGWYDATPEKSTHYSHFESEGIFASPPLRRIIILQMLLQVIFH